ncbi:MAG: hypothetical protein A3J66_03155 [Candidatus Magasanikbacteria bacterium RIFCSPHIGHO2_02_FULL_47_14]|uniref:NodB homology domain-containing protein n=1 Tax=Candidatus Magasanikbacteria bacterium RIFCSPHIGHO2_02_FULL_47_14 TaxID=1798680 RepID=A0A1F6MAA9_9BACT|nr:MAG: hypothetical protein A3J66_03155 [Candidatus Magasanikbacteria bacterium RIFCSPHIGHO2_02_FULL_47_14]
MIGERLGVNPTSYRAARFGADGDTWQSLQSLGYHVDSSVTPGIDWSYQGGPNFRQYPVQPYFINKENTQRFSEPLLEVPITIQGKRFAFAPDRWLWYRWLRPTHMSAYEQRRLIDDTIRLYRSNDYVVFCLMFHSMEIIPRATPYTRSEWSVAWYVRRLTKVLDGLALKGCSFVTLEELYQIYASLRI